MANYWCCLDVYTAFYSRLLYQKGFKPIIWVLFTFWHYATLFRNRVLRISGTVKIKVWLHIKAYYWKTNLGLSRVRLYKFHSNSNRCFRKWSLNGKQPRSMPGMIQQTCRHFLFPEMLDNSFIRRSKVEACDMNIRSAFAPSIHTAEHLGFQTGNQAFSLEPKMKFRQAIKHSGRLCLE